MKDKFVKISTETCLAFFHNVFMWGSQEPVKYYLHARCPTLRVNSASRNLWMSWVSMLMSPYFLT